jgi:hypothetical protein
MAVMQHRRSLPRPLTQLRAARLKAIGTIITMVEAKWGHLKGAPQLGWELMDQPMALQA